MPRRISGQLRTIQALRAVAALFVVVFHTTVLWGDRAEPGTVTPWTQGNAGVDLFFVISGFIMVLSSRGLEAQPKGWMRFIRARLVRVVPLYWLATAAKLAAMALWPAAVLHTAPTPWNVAASFLFIPSRNATGEIAPVLVVGWTLSFELLFYAAVAAALAMRKAPLAVAAPAMAVIAATSLCKDATWPVPSFLLDPVVLEFVFGMAAAHVLLRPGTRAHPATSVLAGAAGLLAMLLIPAVGPWERTLYWGGGATAVLWAAVSAEPWAGRRIPQPIVAVGEASYSLYLTHGFVLPMVGLAAVAVGLGRWPVPGPLAALAFLLAAVGASVAAALLVFRCIEQPLVNRVRRLTQARQPRLAARPGAMT